jgi:predicted nucleic acid-binding protein
MAYLIDTDVLIDVSRGNPSAIDYLDQLSNSWTISIITALELIVGARDKREAAQIDKLIATYSTIPLDDAIGKLAYDLLTLYAGSHGLRVFDSLIAATALQKNFILASKNRRHFHMISNLRLEVPQY